MMIAETMWSETVMTSFMLLHSLLDSEQNHQNASQDNKQV
jgi:hypothetical protein